LNFLSHFNILPDHHDPALCIGSVMPDLIRASGILKIKKSLVMDDPYHAAIERGISFHLHADHVFHNSIYFETWQKALNHLIEKEKLETLPKYLNFYGHVLIEMWIDRILLLTNQNVGELFYVNLEKIEKEKLKVWWEIRFINHIEEFDFFWNFYIKFINQKFVLAYTTEAGFKSAIKGLAYRVHHYRLSEYDLSFLFDACNGVNELIVSEQKDFWTSMKSGLLAYLPN
jgi:hypothetical protein